MQYEIKKYFLFIYFIILLYYYKHFKTMEDAPSNLSKLDQKFEKFGLYQTKIIQFQTKQNFGLNYFRLAQSAQSYFFEIIIIEKKII